MSQAYALLRLQIPYTKVLRFINKVAGAIHRAVPGAKVTVGAHSMPYTTDLPMPALFYDNAPMNYYSDDLLVRCVYCTTGLCCGLQGSGLQGFVFCQHQPG